MKLKTLSDNAHVITFANGNEVLFSYETPVAISFARAVGNYFGCYKTSEKFSKTTSKWINVWTATERTLPQVELEALVDKMGGC